MTQTQITDKICNICKKEIPKADIEIKEPCVCKDWREQLAKKGQSMHKKTLEIYKIKRKEYLRKQAEKYI